MDQKLKYKNDNYKTLKRKHREKKVFFLRQKTLRKKKNRANTSQHWIWQ